MGVVRAARESGNLLGEEWREIRYGNAVAEVSNMGRARFTFTPKPCTTGKYAALKLDKWSRSFHVWVAEAFHGPCPKGKIVDHKDGDKENNWADNLQYVTYTQNNRKGKGTKLDMDKAREIRRRYTIGESLASLGRDFGVCYVTVFHLVKGNIWKEQ